MSTNINDPNLAPVSFIRGGLQRGAQVHLEGTFAYLPREMAEWSEEDQIRELGDVYFTKGIRPGFLPASETYLSPTYRQRVQRDQAEYINRRLKESSEEGSPVAAAVARAEGIEPEQPPALDKPEGEPGEPPEGESEESAGEPSSESVEPTEIRPPWPDAEDLNIEATRERLATATDEEVDQFKLWEESRPRPRVTLLRELEG